ncbi:inositol monophosphatase family protein [Roseofilum sp. BLCC_M91]|uniref:Inositol-1-monophosphatase n=1 Tax=Roseofilum halophilum BLCC-M91 TaxID=3022259 RepID=A0ABT7BKR2_9CYAN|nr:inositol monophosphatase family protein [Roseofilum halophilum]MDJ1179770.1 inositol monophosphatase family protein [Roseofilum halophilum BLCC-M91]
MSDPLQTYLEIATEAALAGGAMVMSYQGKLQDIREKGRPGDIVTEADKASEAVILEILQRHFPDHGILAEESGKLGDRQSRYLWAIDPLDGTTNYSHGYPNFSVSIGLLIDGVPQVGVVFDPSRQELFRAAQGLGATLNRQAIATSSTPTLADSLLVTGFAYDRRETNDNNYAQFCHLTHLTQGVRRGGSAAIDLAYVASGRLDGYWERGLSPWDLTAGVVLVQEAGGKISAYNGSPFNIESGRILATNGHLHDPMVEILGQISPFPPQWRESAEWGKSTLE